MLLSFAGLFLSGFVSGYLVFWQRQRFQRSWLHAFQKRKHSMRHRPSYHVRIARRATTFGRYYGHVPRFHRRDFV